jgi:DNA-binding transcriptional ArsR family regulator
MICPVEAPTVISEDEIERSAAIFAALASGIRVTILHYLLAHREATVTDIHRFLGITQSNTSQQLWHLAQAKIVKSRRVGTYRWYSCCDPDDVRTLLTIAGRPAKEGRRIDLFRTPEPAF